MVHAQFLSTLAGFGVTRLASIGEPFDPSRHEAAATVPAADADADGTVVGVIKHGYAIGEELLRPATVAVARVDD
jgi:molecular chaperone GrpE